MNDITFCARTDCDATYCHRHKSRMPINTPVSIAIFDCPYLADRKSLVDPTDDDFGMMLNCAVRYSLGRQTYMPHAVMEFTTPLLHFLSDKTLWCFDQDLKEATNFGDKDIDKPAWRKFHERVQKEIANRECKHESD